MEYSRITDLTQSLREPMRGFKTSVAKRMEEDGWNASTLEIYSHAGTHMDAHIHFNVSRESIDEIQTERFICKAHVARLAPARHSQLIKPSDIENILDKIEPGDGIIFHTGWSKFADDPSIFRDQLPRISESLSRILVEKKVNMIGVEPPSVADVNNIKELQSVHRILMEGNVIIVEGLCNIENIQSDQVTLIALPLKVFRGDGAPARVIALE